MMNFNKQKFLIALVCSALGWGVGFQMGKKSALEECAQQGAKFGVSQFFGIPFQPPFLKNFPQAPAEKAPRSLFERFFGKSQKESDEKHSEEQEDSFLDSPFSLFSGEGHQPQIKTHEDDNTVFMEISLESFDKNSLSARVEGGSVVVEGNQKSEDQGSSMTSHFYQSFPVPGDTDPSKVDMVHENNKLILKFPKIKR